MNKTTVLIVEDEAIVAADLAGKLDQLGYAVVGTAATGEQAVESACRLQPHVVLMDILLKGPMDGIQAAEAIRLKVDVPIIYLTAYSDPATVERAKVTGPFGYILKPFEERELATQIEMALFKHQSERELREQREWLRVTLTSIGDALIATDAEGRVTFVNPVAEALTGWKTGEASGQPLSSVFRIINEKTGQALEDPVARVLREGRAVALANHAALVTRDSRTVPIEDSAAPILDAEGRVIGVVLVFHDVTAKRRAEEALRESEARRQVTEAVQAERKRLYDVLDTLPAMICLLTPDYHIAFANRSFREKFGETSGRHCYESCFGLPVPCEFCETYKVLETGKPHHWEVTAPDGVGVIDVHDFPFTDVDGSHLILEMDIDITDRKRAEEELKEKNVELANLTSRLVSAQENERRRVSYDLHDNVWQTLLALRTEIELLVSDRNATDRAALQEKSRNLLEGILDLVGRIRSMQGDLWPYVLDDIGMASTIDWYCREFEEKHPGISIEKFVGLSDAEIPSPSRIVIYRILQESLSNTAKYSQASRVVVRLTRRDHGVEFTVRDNGSGFDPGEMIAKRAAWGGLGLLSIKARTELSGGSFDVQSAKGMGTIVKATWPL